MYPVIFGEEKRKKDKGKLEYKGKYINKLIKFYGKYKHVLGVLIVMGVVGYLSLFVYRTDIRVAMNSTRDCSVQKISEGKLRVKNDTKEITQGFTIDEDLIGVSVGFFRDTYKENQQGNIHATVIKNGTETISDYNIQLSEISNQIFWQQLLSDPTFGHLRMGSLRIF